MNPIIKSDLDILWNALEFYRQHGIPECNPEYDTEWNDICTLMAWIEEDYKPC